MKKCVTFFLTKMTDFFSSIFLTTFLPQPANENSGPAFKFSYGCKFFTFLDSPSCAPRRLGGDCVFAIALLAPTFRQRSTYYRVRLVL